MRRTVAGHDLRHHRRGIVGLAAAYHLGERTDDGIPIVDTNAVVGLWLTVLNTEGMQLAPALLLNANPLTGLRRFVGGVENLEDGQRVGQVCWRRSVALAGREEPPDVLPTP